jgi:hypothetical protein
LRFRPAGARLDVHEAAVRVERVGEHAPELECSDILFEFFYIQKNTGESRIIILGAGHVEELFGVRNAAADAPERADQALQLLLLLAQLLRALRVVPQLRVLELAVQRLQALFLGLEVKDTSAAQPIATAERRASWRSG